MSFIGVYHRFGMGSIWGYTRPNGGNMPKNTTVIQKLAALGIKHYTLQKLAKASDHRELNELHWQMLKQEGFSAGFYFDVNMNEPIAEDQLAKYAYMDEIENATDIYFAHEVYEFLNWEEREAQRKLFDQYFPNTPMRVVWGLTGLTIANHRVGKNHPAGGKWHHYIFGNEADEHKGHRVVVHFSIGGSHENNLPRYGTLEPNPIRDKFLSQKLFVDSFSPHGHLIATHINVTESNPDKSNMVETLKTLAVNGADFVYLRSIADDLSGASADTSDLMLEAIGEATKAIE